MIRCRLLTAITEWVYCDAWYGTDPSHHVLPYHDTSDNAGVGGDVLTIHISHDLQLHTTYYYNVSLVAVDGNISARVLHSIRIGKEIKVHYYKQIGKKDIKMITNAYNCNFNLHGASVSVMCNSGHYHTMFP